MNSRIGKKQTYGSELRTHATATFTEYLRRARDRVHATLLRRNQPFRLASGTEYLRNGKTLDAIFLEIFNQTPCAIRCVPVGANGCSSYWVRCAAGIFKCYETDTPQRAELVLRTTELIQAAGVAIPVVHGVVDHVVVSNWVSGKGLTSRKARNEWMRLCDYQGRLHAVTPATVNSRGLLHVGWLLQRMVSAGRDYYGTDELPMLAECLLAKAPENLQVRVLVPDFIAPNIVVDENAEWTLIDNEFLGIGAGFEFDILNTARITFSNRRDAQEAYIRRYDARFGCGTLMSHRPFWEACFLVKLAGKRFSQGDKAAGINAIDKLREKLRDCTN